MDYIMEALSAEESNREVIPASCLSFSEMADYAAEFTNEEFNKMLECIGLDELAVFEATGSLIVYEAENLAKLKSRIANHVKDIWAVYKNFWEKCITDIQNDVKIASKLPAADLSDIDKTKSFGKVHKFEFKSKYDSNALAFSREIKKTFNGIADEDGEAAKEAKNLLSDVICSKISGVECKTSREMKKALKSKINGEVVTVNGAWVKRNWNNIMDVVNGKKSAELAKEAYNKEKEAFSQITAQLDSIDNDISGIVAAWSYMIDTTLSTMHTCYAVEMDACKRRLKEYTNIVAKVSSMYPAKKAVKESNEEKTDAPAPAEEKEDTDTAVEESFAIEEDNTEHEVSESVKIVDQVFNF